MPLRYIKRVFHLKVRILHANPRTNLHNMKKYILLITFLAAASGIFARPYTESDFTAAETAPFDTNGDGKVKDIEAALAIKDLYSIDTNGGITYTTVIDSIPKTKEQIYIAVNDWFARSFLNLLSSVRFSDREAGCVIARGHISDIGNVTTFSNDADISADIIIRVDIKEGRMRISTTLQRYVMFEDNSWLGALTGLSGEKNCNFYTPSKCFPFTDYHKKEGAKALFRCHLHCQRFINNLSDAVINGINGSYCDW